MYQYESVDQAIAAKCLLTQTTGNILATRPQHGSVDSLMSQFVIREAAIHNRSGSAAVLGIGGRLPVSLWTFGFWDDSEYAAGTVYADDTTDAQDAGAGDVNLDTVGTNNDGFVIGCETPFELASLIISQASANGTAWKLYYSITSAGTGFASNFTEITNAFVMPSFTATGEQLIWIAKPQDWVKVASATAVANKHGATVPSQYLLVIKSTTAPDTTRGQMTVGMLARILYAQEAVADNATWSLAGDVERRLPPQCDALVAAISVSNVQNRATVQYRMAG